MIRRVKLVNFLSHRSTEIGFDEGLTVFIGRNGSGKSSVIDAVTYALYGRHQRGKNAHIVRDGSSGGSVELELELGGSVFHVIRRFDGKGNLLAAAVRRDGALVVTGEKRDDERVSEAVSRLLGMSYERMTSSVLIQQGEVDAILRADPKELKQLFDDLLGLSALERAYEGMRDAIHGFRERVRIRTGYYPEEAQRIEQELGELRRKVEEAEARMRELGEQLELKRREHEELRRRMERLEELERMHADLRGLLERLRERVRAEARGREERLQRLEEAIRTLRRRSEVEERVRRLDELRGELTALRERERALRRQLDEVEGELGRMQAPGFPARSLGELTGEARRRAERLRDDSIELGRALASGTDDPGLRRAVEEDLEGVVGLVQEVYGSAMATRYAELVGKREELTSELNSVRGRLKEVEREMLEASRLGDLDVNRLHQLILASEREVMEAGGEAGVARLRQELERISGIREALEAARVIELDPLLVTSAEEALGDEEGRQLASQLRVGISRLREEGYSPEAAAELSDLRVRSEILSRQIGYAESELQTLRRTSEEASGRIQELERVLGVLRRAAEFHGLMERVREELYHRDGRVLGSLRTWIYARVSERARDYLDLFDSPIDDVRIEEERSGRAGRVSFRCYYRGREVSWERLSGGEKVVLALALRLAIGDVLGAQRLRFFVLDEPTVHLDSEKRRRLREVLMRLGRRMPQVIV
ncbi:MAG: SMC family ATPase, partial [Nitrososphaerota archaeon]